MITYILILAIAGGMLIMEKIKERKKMIDIKVSEDYLRRMLEYQREFIDNTNNDNLIYECQEDITRTRKLLRMGEPRDRKMREIFQLKVKEAHRWGW